MLLFLTFVCKLKNVQRIQKMFIFINVLFTNSKNGNFQKKCSHFPNLFTSSKWSCVWKMFALSVFCSCFSENVLHFQGILFDFRKKCRIHVVPLFWIFIFLRFPKMFQVLIFLSLWNMKMFAAYVHIRRTAILCAKCQELWWLLALLTCCRLLFIPAAVVRFFKSGALILTWKVDYHSG